MDITMCVGRVGALAVALGIGTAIAGMGTAAAAPEVTSTAPHQSDQKTGSDQPHRAKTSRAQGKTDEPRKARSAQAVAAVAAPKVPPQNPAAVQPNPGTPRAVVTPPKKVPSQLSSAAPNVGAANAKSVQVEVISTGVSTPAAQLPTTASVTTPAGPSSNGAAPSAPIGAPIAWTIAAWTRRAPSPAQATAPAAQTTTSAPTQTTDIAAQPTPATATTTSTTSLTTLLKPVTAIRTSRSSLAAGTPTVGTPDATTGAVSGSLNVKNQGTGTVTYTVSAQPNYGTVTVNTDGTFTYTPTKLARDLSAVSANANTSSFTVLASSGSSKVSETVTVPVLATPITGDSTAVLQNVFSNLKPGSTLTLAPKTFYHSGILQITVSGLTINGNGATLQATNDATSAVEILADHVTMSNLTLGANLTGPRYYADEQHKLLIKGNYATVSNVTINGAAGAGIYVLGAGWFNLTGITVNNSRADGISMTGGAHDGVVNNPVTNSTGDDGVSVVSYIADGTICSNITINNPIVNGTTWGRGVTVVGGQNITYNNIKVSNTNGAGVYIASEPSYNTMGVSNIIVNGGTVTGANYNSGVVHGAILVYAGNTGQPATGVTIENLSVTGTPLTAQREIGLIQETGSSMSGIVFKNISFDKTTLPIFYTNTPSGSYSASGITMGGTTIIA
ncbi:MULTISPECIES: right-handed parallel beta-helix repeat-containing protein [unclassified Mycobacterium]|uniref:right-handed parallel beta-helix repeat-containing protein n=1 Tax=unclassified Mycobacterium TaxID=2642494 RepID=UPI000690A18B|nr:MULTISPECIES: right-handed parallel beta-helix repeat-containing protein [unclassified Mycobacterium]SEA48886.1 VCBS repeat-containing protein [Mycobacterium sp. 283mftsu]